MKKEESLSSVLIALVIIIGLIPVAAVGQAWALAKLWGWFVVEQFGVATPSMTVLYGISLIVGMLTHQSESKSDPDKSVWDGVAKMVGLAIARPLLIVFFGYVAHSLGGAQ